MLFRITNIAFSFKLGLRPRYTLSSERLLFWSSPYNQTFTYFFLSITSFLKFFRI
ncbi:hypothetical protein HanRHA438_Chr17g0835331 [Helianthus annuus]|nr:hypothetical protein HanRHA438_Chr17g0835331 [Helianthus annuus]